MRTESPAPLRRSEKRRPRSPAPKNRGGPGGAAPPWRGITTGLHRAKQVDCPYLMATVDQHFPCGTIRVRRGQFEADLLFQVVLYREGREWIAHGLELNIADHGSTPHAAL